MGVKIDFLNKNIHGIPVLKDICLDLHAGNIYGLSGDNGSGKTMMLKVISGLVKPTTGSVSYDNLQLGKDISVPPSIGVLIERPSFIGKYSGFKNLFMLSKIQGRISKDRVAEAIKDVLLDPNDRRPYRKYSLGMKQKLGIACALMENPDVVLLDEPFNALDEKGESAVKNLFLKHRDRGAIIVIATHDSSYLTDICDTKLVMCKGSLQ